MSVRFGLEGRCGLVTGGTSDVGRACVERLRQEGMAIWFTGSERRRGEAIAEQTGASFVTCDHRDRAGSDEAVEHALGLAGDRLKVLVTNSDRQFTGSIEGTSEADFRELLEVNLTSVVRVARACWQTIRANGGGAMIHVASAAGIRAAHETAAYSVACAGVIAVAELLAAEGAPYGIRSNVVCPGGIRGGSPPAGRLGTGADVASLIAWLASDESKHMTGATLRIDGGAGAAMLLDTRT